MNAKEGREFLKAFKRILNIIENEKNIKNNIYQNELKEELLESSYEKNLHIYFLKNLKNKKANFKTLLYSLNSLSNPINLFFNNVQIYDKNVLLKNNRLCLLSDIKTI